MSNSLQNANNYNIILKENTKYIFSKYVYIINEYVKIFFENVKVQNNDYYLYIFKKGLESLSHIFNLLLLYTNNIEITSFYCEKSYFYYVEFISQLENTGNSFLQLNSKDATLFIYKKTIFDINNDIKKQYNINYENKIKIVNIKILTKIYNCLLLNNFKLYINNLNNLVNDLQKCIYRLFNLYDNDEYQYYENIDIIYCFIEKFLINNNTIQDQNNNTIQDQNNNTIQYIELLINKIKKISDKKDYIKNNITHRDSIMKFNKYSCIKFINYLISY